MFFDQLTPEHNEQPITQTTPVTPDLRNSIFFDLVYFNKPSKRADYLYDLFLGELTDIPHTRVTRKNLRCLAYNLNRLLVKRPEGVLVCPKQSTYWNELGRTINRFEITKKVADLAKKLEELGYVTFKTGSYFKDGSGYSRLWATDKLKALLNDSGLEEEPIIYTEDDDFVFFRPPAPTKYKKVKKRDGSYKNVRNKMPKEPATGTKAKKMSAVLRDYNNLLQQSDIRIHAAQNNGEKIAHDYMVYRVFNNSKLTLGGRYYGAFWHIVDKGLRKEIVINGNATCELDYKAQHPYMVYALVLDKHYDELHTDKSPYLIRNEQGQEYDIAASKILLLTALNASGVKETLQAIRENLREEARGHAKNGRWNEWKKTRKLQKFFRKDGGNFKALLQDCFKKHEPIKSKICSGIGIKLQYIDSQITEYVIKTLTNEGIVVLTVHDSFIVEEQYRQRLYEVMEEAYSEIDLTKALPPIK